MGIYNLINEFNCCFGPTIFNGWNLNIRCRERKSTDYFAKALPGSTSETLNENSNELKNVLSNFKHVNMNSIRLVKHGWSTFAYFYQPGRNFYG